MFDESQENKYFGYLTSNYFFSFKYLCSEDAFQFSGFRISKLSEKKNFDKHKNHKIDTSECDRFWSDYIYNIQ